MMLTLFPLFLAIGFLTPSIDAVSVCDEVDVVFLIDTASIIHNEANIIGLIDSVIVNGSSEFSGFSAVSYGHHLPLTADSVLFHLDDTKHIAHRRETQKVVHGELEKAFESIKGAVNKKSGHTVSVLDAMKHGQSQHSPVAMKRKHELLGEALDYTMGHHDDDTIYIVFDWTNQLMSTHDICKMFEMVDEPGISDHFYFLFGQHLDESIGVNCHREGGGILQNGPSFRHFDEEAFTEHPDEINTIFSLTCPAYVQTPQYHGHVGLHHGVQWMDPETITSCDLHYLPVGHGAPDMLHPELSHIVAKDFPGDGNTFKAMDHLMADPTTFDHIQTKGCGHPVFKITKVMRSQQQHYDALRGAHYHILKLFVALPKAPTDYISSAHIEANDIPMVWQGEPIAFHGHRRLVVHGDDHSNAARNPNNPQLSAEVVQQCPKHVIGEEREQPPKTWTEWLLTKMGDAMKPVAKAIQAGRKAIKAVEYVSTRATKVYQGARWCEQYEWSPTNGVKLTVSYALDVTMHVDRFTFKWNNPFNPSTLNNYACTFEAEMTVDWVLFTLLVVDLEATFEKDWDVLTYSRTDIFPIGPVPVILKSHVNLNVGFAFKKIWIRSTDEWKYGERWQFGYKYQQDKNKKQLKSQPIHQRQKQVNQHSNKVEILDEEGNPTCPIVWGIDFIVTPEIGTSLYYMLSAYLKVPITLELTVDFPVAQLDKDDVCTKPHVDWYFALFYKIDVELLVGAKANPPGIDGYEDKTHQEKIKSIMDAYKAGNPPDIKDFTAEIEFSPFGKFNVVPKTGLGRLTFIPDPKLKMPAAITKAADKVVTILEKQCCKNGKKKARRLLLDWE